MQKNSLDEKNNKNALITLHEVKTESNTNLLLVGQQPTVDVKNFSAAGRMDVTAIDSNSSPDVLQSVTELITSNLPSNTHNDFSTLQNGPKVIVNGINSHITINFTEMQNQSLLPSKLDSHSILTPSSLLEENKIKEKIVRILCQEFVINTKGSNEELENEDLLLYIPIRGTPGHMTGESFDVYEKVSIFLQNDCPKKVMLLMGEAGAGKTKFCQNLTLALGKVYVNDPLSTTTIPIYLSLPHIDNIKEKLDFLSKGLRQKGFSNDEIDYLKQCSVCIILESYDEVSDFQGGKLYNLLSMELLKSWKFLKVIITCRTNFCLTVENYSQYFAPREYEKISYRLLEEVFILPFTWNKEVRQYIINYLNINRHFLEKKGLSSDWLNCEIYFEYIEKLRIKEIVTLPFLLKITMDILPENAQRYLEEIKAGERESLTSYDLIESYVESWFFRQAQKEIAQGTELPTGSSEDDGGGLTFEDYYEAFSQELAYTMFKEKCLTVKYFLATTQRAKKVMFFDKLSQVKPDKNKLSQEIWDEFFSDKNSRNVMARKGCPLKIRRSKENKHCFLTIEFIHSYIRDFFIAKKIIEECIDDINLEQLPFDLKLVKEESLNNSMISSFGS